MYFVSAIEYFRGSYSNVFVTDTKDWVTERYLYDELVSIVDSKKLRVVGLCKNEGLPYIEKFELNMCYFEKSDDYQILARGVDVFFGRNAHFSTSTIYFIDDGITYHDTECIGLYGLIKSVYQLTQSAWTDLITNTGYFHPDYKTIVLMYLRNVYNLKNGLPLLKLHVEKNGAELFTGIEDVDYVEYKDYIYYMYDDIVMRVKKDLVLWDYTQYLNYITKVGLTTGAKLCLKFGRVVVSGKVDTLHLVDDMKYSIESSAKIVNLYIEGVNVSVSVGVSVIENLHAKSYSKCLNAIMQGCSVRRLVITSKAGVSYIRNHHPEIKAMEIKIFIEDIHSSEDMDNFILNCFTDEEWYMLRGESPHNGYSNAYNKAFILRHYVENIHLAGTVCAAVIVV